jgi:hypothetical protein
MFEILVNETMEYFDHIYGLSNLVNRDSRLFYDHIQHCSHTHMSLCMMLRIYLLDMLNLNKENIHC